ncbi:MAG: HDOD domain-containing protein [Deltaproteobacteria bacterium]|nr:HDOD domain-containing protein [Deltaproteobacteria bacterium]
MNNSPHDIKRRVLFVDDEPMVLQGLGRMLRTERNNFQASFASSGPEALSLLSKEHFDVIVTDISMPQMNGLQLLAKVKNQYPDMVRIILSGEPDLDVLMKSVNVSHQFFNKPCDPEVLKTAIMRTCRLSEFLRNDSMKKILTRIDSLPSMPSIYFEITDELQSKNASIQKVGKIISKDAALTSKILQLVNSAYFSLPRHIASPEHAAVLLGINIIKSLVLVTQVFKKYDKLDMPGNFLQSLWSHNILTANFAKAIAKEESRDQKIVDNAFIAGLLHDCGKLILASNFTEEYREIITNSHENSRPLWSQEEETLGITHAEVGAYLMELWGLPSSIIEAIAFHHNPSLYGDNCFSPLTAVYIANSLGRKNPHEGGSGDEAEIQMEIDINYLAGMNLDNKMDNWGIIRQNIINGAD